MVDAIKQRKNLLANQLNFLTKMKEVVMKEYDPKTSKIFLKALKLKKLENKQTSKNLRKLTKFKHNPIGDHFLNKKIVELGDHPIAQGFESLRKSTALEKVERVENDFKNCISNKILTIKQMARRRKKREIHTSKPSHSKHHSMSKFRKAKNPSLRLLKNVCRNR